MKTLKMTKRIMTALLSALIVLGMMTTTSALTEGCTVSESALNAELGSPLYSITATGQETTTAMSNASNTTTFYTHLEGQDASKTAAEFVNDATLNSTVVKLKSTQLVSFTGDYGFNTGTKNGTYTNSQNTTKDKYEGYLGVVGAKSVAAKSETTYTTNADGEQEYAFSINFKAPVNENVTTWLFNSWNNVEHLKYDVLRGGLALAKGIEIRKGYVYIASSGFSSESGTALNTEPLSADKWYRAVRIMKFPAKNQYAVEKVIVLERNDTTGEYDKVVAQSSLTEWSTTDHQAGTYRFVDMLFVAEYPENYSGAEVLINNHNTYTVDKVSNQAESVGAKRRALSVNLTGNGSAYTTVVGYGMVFVADRFNGAAGKSMSSYVTFMLPDVGENSVMQLFRMNMKAKYAGVAGGASNIATLAPYADSFALTIKGNKLYANTYAATSTLDGGTYGRSSVELSEISSGVYYTSQEMYSNLTANEWYTVELTRSDISSTGGTNVAKLYKGKISRNESNLVVADALAAWGDTSGETFVLPYVSTAANLTTDYLGSMSFVSGAKYSGDVYIDAMDLKTWTEANFTGEIESTNSYGVADNWTKGHAQDSKVYGEADVNVNSLFHTFRVYANSGNDIQEDTTFDSYAKVVEIAAADYIKTGVIDHRDAENIKITYSAPINFDESMVSLTDAAGGALQLNASYDDDTYTITVEISDRLEYGGNYTLTVGNTTTENLGYAVSGANYKFKCEDLFVASDFILLDSEENTVTTELGEGAYTAKVKLVNNSAEDRNYVVLLAVYKGNQMIKIMPKTGKIMSGITQTVETDALAITSTEAGCTAKIMVWDSLVNIAPKSAAAQIPQP